MNALFKKQWVFLTQSDRRKLRLILVSVETRMLLNINQNFSCLLRRRSISVAALDNHCYLPCLTPVWIGLDCINMQEDCNLFIPSEEEAMKCSLSESHWRCVEEPGAGIIRQLIVLFSSGNVSELKWKWLSVICPAHAAKLSLDGKEKACTSSWCFLTNTNDKLKLLVNAWEVK